MLSSGGIEDRLKGSEYSFLRDGEFRGGGIILLTLGGSYAYGLNIDSSDIDIRGICLNTRDEILSMNYREKPYEDSRTDTVIYPLKKIVDLLLDVNPNCIEILGTEEEHIIKITEIGKVLRDNVELFLSKRAIGSFGGYALSNLNRIRSMINKEERLRGDISDFECIEHRLESLKRRYEDKLGEGIRFCSCGGDINSMRLDLDFKGVYLRDFKGFCGELDDILDSVSSLGHRNKKRSVESLNKHVMHLVRLLIMGTEILEGKGVNTYREKDKDFLMGIREGKYIKVRNEKYDFNDLFNLVDEYRCRFDYAAENTELPDKPRYKEVKDLVMGINKKVVEGY